MSKAQIRSVTNTKLAFYKEKLDTITILINKVISNAVPTIDTSNIDIDIVLFHLSSC